MSAQEQKRGPLSSFINNLEFGLGSLKQSVATRLAPIKQTGVKMARATKEMSLLTKVELGIAAVGVVTAMTELVHAFPYAVGLEDSQEFQPIVIPAVMAMFKEMFPPVSSVEGDQAPIPTLVPVTPEGTPLFSGVLTPGTAVVEATGEVITVTSAAPVAETATQASTATATLEPSATARPTAEATKDTYRQSLTAEQQAVYDAAPSQAGLEKQFLPGGLSEYLGYQDGSGEVTAIYDPERQKVFPALLNGDGNLFINEGPSDIVYNEELKGGLETAKTNTSLLVDYFRAKLCARALGKDQPRLVKEIQPFMDSIAGQTCNVILRAVSKDIPNPGAPNPRDWGYSVPRQNIVISDQTPVVVRFTGREEVLGEKGNRIMHLNVGANLNEDLSFSGTIWVIGVGVNQTGNNSPIEITVFHQGASRQDQFGPLASWLHEAMFMIFDRGGYYYEPWERINPVDELLVNYWRGEVDISPLEFVRHKD